MPTGFSPLAPIPDGNYKSTSRDGEITMDQSDSSEKIEENNKGYRFAMIIPMHKSQSSKNI